MRNRIMTFKSIRGESSRSREKKNGKKEKEKLKKTFPTISRKEHHGKPNAK